MFTANEHKQCFIKKKPRKYYFYEVQNEMIHNQSYSLHVSSYRAFDIHRSYSGFTRVSLVNHLISHYSKIAVQGTSTLYSILTSAPVLLIIHLHDGTILVVSCQNLLNSIFQFQLVLLYICALHLS